MSVCFVSFFFIKKLLFDLYLADLDYPAPEAPLKKSKLNKDKETLFQKKGTFLFLLRFITLLLPLTLMREAESILKDTHKSSQAHLANMSLMLFGPVSVWRNKTCL